MKLPLLAAALVALTFTACDGKRPIQAEQAGSDTYGTNMEDGSTLGAERESMGLPTDVGVVIDKDEDMSGSAEGALPPVMVDGNGNPLKPGQEAHKPNQLH